MWTIVDNFVHFCYIFCMDKKIYASSIARKKEIARAYIELLNTKKKFSVTDLVAQAKINRGTFYLHFKNLNDVENYIEEYLAQNFKMLEVDFRLTDISKTPEVILNKLNEILLKDLEFYKVIIRAENNALMKKIQHSVFVSISNNFEIMKYVTKLENFEITVRQIVGGCTGVYTDWLKGKINCPITEVSEFMTKLIRNGLNGVIKYGNKDF